MTGVEQTNMNEVYLLIGGNIGERQTYLASAVQEIENQCGHITAISSLYETAAWGLEDQSPFLNQALKINTSLSAQELLTTILGIEKELGRRRFEKYGPRIIDIDILFFNDEIINLPDLSVPHPQMQYRRFVLTPLNEIAPDKMHPVFQKTVAELLAECPDPLTVYKIN
ncbi:MAG TPA: 2-amino-4-hydroxy-6-hydroxymethyldihydropteridine diphosphokinase [Flavisolibacter sp.]|nr:2-amino-4-hydroxy-6-hydroxymethyldihydropteridine diphosphokinase [Flavisolibacter sp.]